MFATECHESYLVGPGGAWNGTCYPRQVKAKFSNVRLCIRQNVSVGNPSPNEEFPIDYGSMRVVPAKIISEISPEHFNVLRVERAKALEGLRADSVLHCYMMVSLRPYKLLFGGTARQCFCCDIGNSCYSRSSPAVFNARIKNPRMRAVRRIQISPIGIDSLEGYEGSLDRFQGFSGDLIGLGCNYKLTPISRLRLNNLFLHEIGLPVVNHGLYAGDYEHKESYSESRFFHPVYWRPVAFADVSPFSSSPERTPNANAYGFVWLLLGGICLACGIILCRGCYNGIDDSLLLALTTGIVGCIGCVIGIVLLIAFYKLVIHGAALIDPM
jgi:hypothetical protein